jgi:hypothetical protein
MPTIIVPLADLEAELRALPRRDIAAIRLAIQRTIEVDAHRWIQWSIKGGGSGGQPAKRPTKGPKKRKRPNIVRKVLKKLGGLLRRGKVPKVPAAPKKKEDPCSRPPQQGYRQPVDTGDYKNSWKSQMLGEGGIFYSSPNPPIKAGVIEEGRRAAPIPIEPLALWVRRKFGCKDPNKARSIAIAISKAASKTKRPGLHVLRRAHPKIVEAMSKNLERELRRSISSAVSSKAVQRT